jgi:NADH-quinone oxidoreductase subunit L
MHHDQDIRNMGGIRKYMPITYICMLIGSLALIGFPGFAGFFSKDAIIEAVHASHIPGAGFAYVAVVLGVFITAFYSFRMFFLVFHGKERMDHHTREHLHESPKVVTVPLILLAIPSVLAGAYYIEPMLFGDLFADSIYVKPEHDVLGHLGEHYTGIGGFMAHGVMALPFYLAMAGLIVAAYFYLKRPDIPAMIKSKCGLLYRILDNKYGFDDFNEAFFAGGSRGLGRLFWNAGDVKLIDGLVVNGSAHTVGRIAARIRHAQSGYLYHYAFVMIIGLLVMITWLNFG